MTMFSIDAPALSRAFVDRSEDLRSPDRLARSWRNAKVLLVSPGGHLPTAAEPDGLRLVFEGTARWGAAPPPGAVLLGRLDGVDHWAVPYQWPDSGPNAGPPAGGERADADTIRAIGPLLAGDEAALATTAVALLAWHDAAGFCSRCGRPTVPDISGHTRTCPEGHQEFPRTDPAVIVLVHDGGDRMVMARQPSWAPGRFSVLAGFAEAGESLEATVLREIGEEVGLPVRDVQYLGSQPWPFPRSLMIAFAARAPRGADLRPRPGEIEDARWFSRAELRLLLDESKPAAGPVAGITLPGPVSIARRMVEGFVKAG
ncbi:MAG: hypothetical protein BGO26_02110 [Actinobacteria bacterium 69-20]|jgi:NAD+ diphosphatase|nr:NAD(+) diphosphatase [Actinomycetota bacterium]OJV31269.1 MAG: hypothetical protein BGO26_02110 [Actinobacteria bacterium 69-20]